MEPRYRRRNIIGELSAIFTTFSKWKKGTERGRIWFINPSSIDFDEVFCTCVEYKNTAGEVVLKFCNYEYFFGKKF